VEPTSTVCSQCGTALDHVALDGLCPRCVALDMFTPAPTDAIVSPEIDRLRVLGKYEILEEIARGGMGVVYRARQIELDRIVAVKTIGAGVLAGDEAITRFQQEATMAASLNHPNIVAIHEVGQFQGQHYFAMEYVAGPTLAQVVKEGPLPAKRAATYLLAVGQAVEYAHGRGLLHRDLKPSNILLDQHDRPRVTDFGLAKRLNADQEITLSGQVLGTPAFTAPEQAGRKAATIGPWSDVYGLGAVLYHLITARPPFTGESATEILAQVIESEPIAPRLLHPALDRDLETICLKCLEKDPARRYGSAKEFCSDLSRFLENEPILARPINFAERTGRWCKRRPALSTALGAIALLLVGIALLSLLAERGVERLRL
jgi:eukaryotic-like serine/threonine-protein kinase